MIRKLKRKIAAFSVVTLCGVMFHQPEARSNPALAAPAACATGVGCALVGIAVIGGISYYVWQDNRTGTRYRASANGTILQSSDDEKYNIPGVIEIHYAASAEGCRAMLRRFRNEGRSLTLRIRRVGGALPYKCIFRGRDAEAGYYDDRRYR